MLIVLTWCDRDHMTKNGIVHLDCWRTKILPLLGVLSALIFILWGFCPMVLLSIGAFLCAPTWCWLSTNVVIVITWPEMWLYNLIVVVLKYCLFWGFCPLWFLSFWGFCPMVLLSIGAFLCAPTWCWLSSPVVIMITWPEMGMYTLIVGVLKYCLFWGFCPLWFLSFGAFVLWCFCPLGLFSVRPLMLIVHTWCDRDLMTRNGIVHLDCWRTKILPLLGVLSALIFILWGFCPMVLLSHWGFSLCAHWCWLSTPGAIVISWPEMGLYTLIVGVLKYCLFWGFYPLWFLSFGAFVLWCFCPLGIFSVCPRDVDCPHLLWSWSHDQKWDCTPWLLVF